MLFHLVLLLSSTCIASGLSLVEAPADDRRKIQSSIKLESKPSNTKDVHLSLISKDEDATFGFRYRLKRKIEDALEAARLDVRSNNHASKIPGVTISLKAIPLASSYIDSSGGSVRYSGASISGYIEMSVMGGIQITKTFEGQYQDMSKVLGGDKFGSPKQAPYWEALYASNFYEALGETINAQWGHGTSVAYWEYLSQYGGHPNLRKTAMKSLKTIKGEPQKWKK
ncbi:MAG: hypothetical protein KC643_22615 [Nitrospira sp.]|nr:hypothetical protein [Nitrospira sp.]